MNDTKLVIDKFIELLIAFYELKKEKEYLKFDLYYNKEYGLVLENSKKDERVRIGVMVIDDNSKRPCFVMSWSYQTIKGMGIEFFKEVIKYTDQLFFFQECLKSSRKGGTDLLLGKSYSKNNVKEIENMPLKDLKAPPPIGVMPQEIWKEKCRQNRIVDLRNAMNRYIAAEKDIPFRWAVELDELETESREYSQKYDKKL